MTKFATHDERGYLNLVYAIKSVIASTDHSIQEYPEKNLKEGLSEPHL